MTRTALSVLNRIYEWTVGSLIAAAALFSLYSIWDNAQIYQAVRDLQDQIQPLKPAELVGSGPDFEELLALNEDVVAWLTVDGTNIDYPVVQGEDNLEYMNKDVLSDFSLAGSIFLDVRNNPDFSDNFSLLYGHNMDEHLMFGDLALFLDKDFFEANKTATLLLPGESRDLRVAAVLQLPAGNSEVFDPDVWESSLAGLAEFLEENSIWYWSGLISKLKKYPERYQVTTTVTCSGGSTNNRTVLILIGDKSGYVYTPDEKLLDDDEADKEGAKGGKKYSSGTESGSDGSDDSGGNGGSDDPGGSGGNGGPDDPGGSGGNGGSDDPGGSGGNSGPDDPGGSGGNGGSNGSGISGGGSSSNGSGTPGGEGSSGLSGDLETDDSQIKQGTQAGQYEHGLPKTGDQDDKQFWIRVIVGMLLFIFLYECWDRRMDRRYYY
ncbi:MAG: class B sortase [Lachnospiraceae bacterium]|nr:class B sortase [Lachnospiraceae bacterium]